MKIVVVGGTGLIGSKVVSQLRDHGHEAVAASPRNGINSITGEGLADALHGASAVVDVTNSTAADAAAVREFFETSTRNLLAAEAAAGVGHHVALSIVGVDRPAVNPYYVAKFAQEKAVAAGKVPYTIVRATQFFEFIDGIADAATVGDEVRVPAIAFQPIAAVDVASALVEAALHAPVNGVVETAGPDRFRFDEVVRLRLSARHDPRRVFADPKAGYFGAVPDELALVPLGDVHTGKTRLEDWLRTAATP